MAPHQLSLFPNVQFIHELHLARLKTQTFSPSAALNADYPGSNGTVRYQESRLGVYRWFDGKEIESFVRFGQGLSYTHFA
jgi:hypothetical protein